MGVEVAWQSENGELFGCQRLAMSAPRNSLVGHVVLVYTGATCFFKGWLPLQERLWGYLE